MPGIDLYARFGPRQDRAVFLQPEMRAMFSRDIVMATAQGLCGPIRDLALFNQPWPFSPRNVRVPIRFWHGNADPIVPLSHSEHLAELISDSELFVLPDLGRFAGFLSTPAVLDDIARIWANRADR